MGGEYFFSHLEYCDIVFTVLIQPKVKCYQIH